jgi:unsaturated pyranuronate lyase
LTTVPFIEASIAVRDGTAAAAPDDISSSHMTASPVRLYRWDEIALEKVTEMLSRKVVSGEREMIVQVYVKRGCLVPMHAHQSEQMTYVLQGAIKFVVGGEEITVREGEVLHIPAGVAHQAEALDDTFELDLFSPIRGEWIVAQDARAED